MGDAVPGGHAVTHSDTLSAPSLAVNVPNAHAMHAVAPLIDAAYVPLNVVHLLVICMYVYTRTYVCIHAYMYYIYVYIYIYILHA